MTTEQTPGSETGASETDYDASVNDWKEVWNETDEFLRKLGEWSTPWLDESWRDGNPIFSAWSPKLRRGLRIIQHDTPDRFAVWRNTFGGRESPDAVDELVVSCPLTEEAKGRVGELWREWLGPGTISLEARPRAPLEVIEPLSIDVNQAA